MNSLSDTDRVKVAHADDPKRWEVALALGVPQVREVTAVNTLSKTVSGGPIVPSVLKGRKVRKVVARSPYEFVGFQK